MGGVGGGVGGGGGGGGVDDAGACKHALLCTVGVFVLIVVSVVLPALFLRLLCSLWPWDSYTSSANEPFATICRNNFQNLLLAVCNNGASCFGVSAKRVCACGRVAPPTRPALALHFKLIAASPARPRRQSVKKVVYLLPLPPFPFSRHRNQRLSLHRVLPLRCRLPRVLSSSCLHGLLQCISLRCALGHAANAGDHRPSLHEGTVCSMSVLNAAWPVRQG